MKTVQNQDDVTAFLATIEDDQKRADCEVVMKLMQDITGEPPKMWGNSIVGFGSYHYKYASGREGDFLVTGFSPRKTALTLYIMDGYQDYSAIMERLGTYKTGKSCLYLKRLSDVDVAVLRELIEASVTYMRKTYPASP